MRRWNGWGDDSIDAPLGEDVLNVLAEWIGRSTPTQDVSLADTIASLPASRLPAEARLSDDAEARVRHARGQSFPDWLAMRFGRMAPYPDVVSFPESHEDVAELYAVAKRHGAILIPYGGGTSVVGHLNVPQGERPVISVDLGRLNRLQHLDETTCLATFGAGVAGPDLEAQLRAHGYMLGHFPQSFEYSTLGGWIVTRSSGQQSLRYGRIENLFAGGRMQTSEAELNIPSLPASSAGPDLREMVMGSEGRLGILTEAQVRVRPVPAHEDFHALFFPDWDAAVEATRRIAQARLPLSMLRLSNSKETETNLTLAGHDRAIAWLKRYLGLRGVGEDRVLLLMGVTGTGNETYYARNEAMTIARQHGGVHLGRGIGRGWQKNRYRGPYMRNSLWAAGYAADTIETAVNWDRVTPLMQAMEAAAEAVFAEQNEKVHAFTHLSHVYPQGSSIYSTFVFRASPDYEENMQRWRMLKTRVSEQIVAHGGTISHQHGVGADHARWLPAEKGEFGMRLIRAQGELADPHGIMPPSNLYS